MAWIARHCRAKVKQNVVCSKRKVLKVGRVPVNGAIVRIVKKAKLPFAFCCFFFSPVDFQVCGVAYSLCYSHYIIVYYNTVLASCNWRQVKLQYIKQSSRWNFEWNFCNWTAISVANDSYSFWLVFECKLVVKFYRIGKFGLKAISKWSCWNDYVRQRERLSSGSISRSILVDQSTGESLHN